MRDLFLKAITLTIIFTSLFFYSCDTLNDALGIDDNPPQYALYPDNYSVSPFETVLLTIEEYSFTDNEYWGSIYGEDVLLIKVNDSQLTFMMPFIPEGERVFEMIIEDVTHDIDFNIIPLEEVENPDEIITNYKNNVASAFDELKNMNELHDLQIELENLQIIENYLNEFEANYSAATEMEKQELAQFMNANPELFDFSHFDYSIFNDSLNANRDFVKWDQKLTSDMNYFTGLVIATGATIGIFNGALLSLNPIAIGISGAALLTEAMLLKSHVKTMLNRTYKPFEFYISGELRSNTIEFSNDTEYYLGIDGTYRTLYNNDQSSSDVIIELVANIDVVTGYWNTVKNNISGVKGDIPSLSGQDNYKVNINESAVTSEFITIQNISNNLVELSGFSNDNSVNVTFHTIAIIDQDFTFDIVYDNPDFGKETLTVSAKLTVDPDSTSLYRESVIGYYLVNNWEGNGPNSILYCDVLENGDAEYTIYNDPSWPDGTKFYGSWWIKKQDKKYYYAESGFWHSGFPVIEIDYPLDYPVYSFNYHNGTNYTKQ
jgi:hypothetical protein